MDCEKCEDLMLDELYGELDDVTSAAVRRHVASCSRCGAMLGDLRATREAVSAALPREEAPASLEDRIFAAEKEARKVVPLRSRTSTFISIAGRWAMRPQTAMAALFLLMIGSTGFLLKGPRASSRSAAAPITVAQEGTPMAAASAASPEALSPNAARGAHGPLEPSLATPPPAAAPAATAAASALAFGDDQPKDLKLDGVYPSKAMARSGPTTADRDEEDKRALTNAGVPGGAPAPASPPAAVAAGGAGGGYGNGTQSQLAASEATGRIADARSNAYGKKEGSADDFSQGMASYNGHQYPQATQAFDRASTGGDLNASLWAARSVRDGQGCASALSRFDSVAQRGGTSYVGADATYDGAQCYAQLGSVDVARARYTQLLAVPSHAARARQALDSLNQVATAQRKAAPAPAAKPKAAAAQPVQGVQAAPPAQQAPMNQAPQQKAAPDNANEKGF